MIGEPSSEGCQSIPANLSGSLEPKRAETCCWLSVSMLTQNVPLASMAFHDRDTLVGQNSTSGGFQRQRRKGLTREADRHVVVHGGDDRDAGAELTQHTAKCARVDLLGHYLKPTLKS